MEIATALLIIVVLFVSSRAELSEVNLPMNEEYRDKRSANLTTDIEVETLPDINIPEVNDQNITKKLGDKVRLTCKAEGHPEPNVQLRKFSNESHLNETVLRAAKKLAVYEIPSLSTSEAGLYLCSAMNSAGSSNKTIRVVINQPILEVYPKNPHVVIAGNLITLECRETAGYPNMPFTWSREDECLFASNVHQSDNGSLTITDIAVYQEGHFNCSASNELASASVTIEIEVRTLPDINIPEITDESITKKLGDEVELICEAESHPEPNVQWQKFSPETESFQAVKSATLNSAVHEIASLLTSEAGLYLCSAVNSAGSSNKTVRVVINQPILEVYPKDPHVVIAGNSITLECRETAGYPNMKFTWSREDECLFASNVHQSDNGSLTITDIAVYQEGHFNCSASNELASASVTIEIEVRTLPDINIPEITDESITKKLGDEVELICEAESHPEPNVQWQKFSPETESFQAVKSATLNSAVHEIASLLTSEAGLYLCSAVNSAGSSNKTVRVVINQPILEVYPKDPHVVIAGKSITLECRESVGYSNMKFTWSREDECLFASNVHQSDNGSLTITDIAVYQEGHFNCSASNELASASVTIEIEVRTLPDINIPEITDESITKKLGDEVELICEAESHPEPNVQWQKFSPETESFQAVKSATLNSAVHEIASLLTSEAGLYLCSAVNSAGSSNKTVRVVINQPILEVYPKDPHVVIAGKSITLECRESVGYSNMTFTWSREDKYLNAPNVHQSHNGSMTITNIAINQEGHYNCSATNGLAYASLTTEIAVTTLPVIKILEITDGYMNKNLGDKVELTCEAKGHPEPQVQWLKFSYDSNSYVIVKPAVPKSAAYEIILSTHETGLYVCSAKNLAGSSNRTVKIAIGSKTHSGATELVVIGGVFVLASTFFVFEVGSETAEAVAVVGIEEILVEEGTEAVVDSSQEKDEQLVLEVYPEGRHVVAAGNSITLECRESAGHSNLLFTWSREDNSLYILNICYSVNCFLKITNITLKQEGRYKCFAHNLREFASIIAEIEVRTLPVIKIPEITNGNITTKLDDRVELTCEAEGHPEPSVQWQKFSNESHSYHTVQRSTTKSATYEITSLSTSEAGLYLCLAVNPAGSSHKTVRVVIREPVLEVYPKDPHVVIAGNAITLECRETAGYPNMTFTWSRDDECSFASNVHQLDNGSFTITDISFHQEGRFNCSASNGVASASITTEIEVRTLPDINIRDMIDGNITKKLGDEVELICEAESHPEPNVQWQKFSPETESFQAVKSATLNSAVPEIASLSTSEAGLYLCSAANPAGSSNKTVRVVINQPVLEVYPKDPHVVIAGNSITLECRETAGYPNMTFTWSREDECSFGSNVHQSDNGSLTITDIAVYQGGPFHCSASNELVSASVTTEIEVRTLPDINIPEITDESITKKLGDKVELLCEAESQPEPNVQWQKFSPETESFQVVKSATLNSAVHEIASLLTSEAGLYLCSAMNPAGSSNKTVRVMVKQPILKIYPNHPHVVIAGSSITLECHESAGYSDMKFTWSREGISTLPSNVHQSENGALTITNIAINQEGRYECSATNGLAAASTIAYITVDSPISNIVVTLELTSSLATFTCQAIGGRASWNWFSKNGYLLENEVVGANKLAIYMLSSKVKKDRIYCCEGFNTAGKLTKCQQFPHMILYPKSLTRHIGDSIELGCTPIGIEASNFHIKWERVRGSPLSKNAIAFDDRLKIPTLAKTDFGPYICVGNYTFDGKLWTFNQRIYIRELVPSK